MKRQEIFVALRKAGLTDRFEYRSVIEYDSSMRLEHFVELISAKAAADEREACAAICAREAQRYGKILHLGHYQQGRGDGAKSIEKTIRARGENV